MPDFTVEQTLSNDGYESICGVDEAGRGPLAGPVCAAAVILGRNTFIEGLNDSKKISPSRREKLYDEIIDKAVDYSIAFADVEEIENLNILNATFLAMNRAISGLKTVDFAIIDGNRKPKDIKIPCLCVVKGDGISNSVAAASILAKVTRDRLLDKYDEKYPVYNFKKHKGYGTKEHIEAIKKYGICDIHRPSFLKNIL